MSYDEESEGEYLGRIDREEADEYRSMTKDALVSAGAFTLAAIALASLITVALTSCGK